MAANNDASQKFLPSNDNEDDVNDDDDSDGTDDDVVVAVATNLTVMVKAMIEFSWSGPVPYCIDVLTMMVG